MKVYLSCSAGEIREHIDDYNEIRKVVFASGHAIEADWIERVFNRKGVKKLSDFEEENLKDEGIEAVGRSDLVIADVSVPSSSVGYQIGVALSKKIPVLCLYSEESGVKRPPQVIEAIRSPLLVIDSYKTGDIKSKIKAFLKNIPSKSLIKFNFIISEEIADYLYWGSSTKGISKSDFLRDVVEKVIDADKNYHEEK